MSSIEETISTKFFAVEDSIINIIEQIKTEVKQFMKVQPRFSNLLNI